MNAETWDMWFSRATQWLLFILIALVPFSIRHVFDSSWNFQTGAYSDFTSLSLYISDFILIALVGLIIIRTSFTKTATQLPKFWAYGVIITITWLILEIIVQQRDFIPLQWYFSARIAFLILLAFAISEIKVSREKISWLITILGGIQAIIATLQFIYQKSLGLYILGESHLSPETLGVAKIVSHGTKMIRGYGTFPHPNLLAGFLVITVIINLYLIAKTCQLPRGENSPRGKLSISRGTIASILLHLMLFANVFGILVTFSRAGILALSISAIIFFGLYAIKHRVKTIIPLFIRFLAILAVSSAILWPFLSTRGTISDDATKERVFYNQVGSKIVEDKPIFGTGPGTSVLHMKQYAETDLKPWEVQPIHNFYLISWAEWGVGALLLIFLILYPLFRLLKRYNDIWSVMLISMGIGLLTLFFFDHYFYTIWPTQILLWILVGLMISNSTYDTASE